MAERSSINSKSRGIPFYLSKMNEMGIELDCLKVFSTAGDIRPPYPYQWLAKSKCREGEEDGYEGDGETPLKAIIDLYKSILSGEAEPYYD